MPDQSKQLKERLAEGFPGERLTLLPSKTVGELARHPIASQLYPVRIGFFPQAESHFMERGDGIDEWIVLVAFQGAGVVSCEDQEASLVAPACIWLPAGKRHRYEADLQNPWSLAWVHLKGRQAEAYLDQLGPPASALDLKQSERVRDRFETLFTFVRAEPEPSTLFSLHTALAHWLAGLAQNHSTQTQHPSPAADRLARVRRYLREHLHRRIDLTEMARIAGCTPNHLSALFRNELHDTPASYFLHLKMAHACEQLRQSDATIAAIAEGLGFEDAFYFSRCFRRCYGLSPSEYRKAR